MCDGELVDAGVRACRLGQLAGVAGPERERAHRQFAGAGALVADFADRDDR
jgi:hypothetical protein